MENFIYKLVPARPSLCCYICPNYTWQGGMQAWWQSPLTLKFFAIHHCHNACTATTTHSYALRIIGCWLQLQGTLKRLPLQMNYAGQKASLYRLVNDPGDLWPPSCLQSSATTHRLTPVTLCSKDQSVVFLPMLFLVSLLRPHSMAVV